MNEKSGPPHDERGDFNELYPLFVKLVDGIRDHNIAEFLYFFIIENQEMRTKFFGSPGARGENPGHHSFKGGLAYHTLHATKLAQSVADHYNAIGIPVNKDIVTAGVILHDIGKVDCYHWQDNPKPKDGKEVEPGYTHTSTGKMFHHIPHGFQMFMMAAHDFNALSEKHSLTEKKIQKLGHIILSHHGRRSWSSPVVPNFVEAYIVHIVEMMDSYVDKYNKGHDVRDLYDH